MDYLAIARIHSNWRNMKARCEKPSNPQYKDYGARGIYVCDAWQDFNTFCQWALDNGYSQELHLDRQDNDGPYSPENCRYVTPTQNSRNKRNNRLIEAFGESKTVAEWAEDPRCVVTDYTLRRRVVYADWDPEEAMTVKRRRDRQSLKCSNGHPMTEDNVYRRGNGFRMCKICTKQRAKDSYDKKKENT
ncbi:hypothetical protein GCM10010149_88700 [Nonomuraea roseoviolacea subsp. roseoviolacea]|uniref:hypothetical protein n=1 Tax=Nonomuraea roseoviolacea TaxID=103837 RepID=UPI0031DAAC23